jgi:hypothetical protein
VSTEKYTLGTVSSLQTPLLKAQRTVPSPSSTQCLRAKSLLSSWRKWNGERTEERKMTQRKRSYSYLKSMTQFTSSLGGSYAFLIASKQVNEGDNWVTHSKQY